jgi:nitrite reductase (NADH) small subunit/3-phenylpropionate/trans-cinnamate dioxygenase ferredoxin subunit
MGPNRTRQTRDLNGVFNSMADFTTVARVGDIPDQQGLAFEVNGRTVAVFHDRGRYHAIDDLCPHMGASLAAGDLEKGIVSCAWHAWRFYISDGTWCDNPRVKVDSFEVRVQGDEIQVRVPPKADSAPPNPA